MAKVKKSDLLGLLGLGLGIAGLFVGSKQEAAAERERSDEMKAEVRSQVNAEMHRNGWLREDNAE